MVEAPSFSVAVSLVIHSRKGKPFVTVHEELAKSSLLHTEKKIPGLTIVQPQYKPVHHVAFGLRFNKL